MATSLYSFVLTILFGSILIFSIMLLLELSPTKPLWAFGTDYFHVAIISFINLAILVVVPLYALRISRLIAGPVQGIIRGMNLLSKGDMTVRLVFHHNEPFVEMLSSFNHGVERLAKPIAEAQRLCEEINAMDLHEDLVRERLHTLQGILKTFKTDQTDLIPY